MIKIFTIKSALTGNNMKKTIIMFLICSFFLLPSLSWGACTTATKELVTSILGIQQYLSVTNLEIPECKNISDGNTQMTFILDEANEKLNNGIRSEISINNSFAEGDTIEYKFSVSMSIINKPKPKGEDWWVIAQWHDQPDQRIGQTWSTYPSSVPPLSIVLYDINGYLNMGIAGFGGQKKALVQIPAGKWIDVIAKIKWSTKEDGIAEFSFITGDVALFKYIHVGANMINNYQHYLKLGQYRSPVYVTRSDVLFKNVSINAL